MATTLTFRSMDESTATDWRQVACSVQGDNTVMPDIVLEMLKRLKGASLCMPVDPYEHCLQTATRAFRDGADDEMVVCALLHDVGDLMAPQNHAEFAASILRPYVSAKNYGVVLLHEIFQGYHYFDKVDLDRNMRDRYRDHPSFAMAAEFCARWDQAAFDRQYVWMPLEAFEPMVRRVLGRTPYTSGAAPHVQYLGFHINMAPGGAVR